MADFSIEGLDHVALAVSDIDRSERFYADILGLERVHEQWDPPRVLAAGGSGVALFPVEMHSGDGTGGEPDIRVLHLAFRVDRESFEAAQDWLRRQDVDFRVSDHNIAHSLYFYDLDGHQLELTTYEV